MSISNYTQEVQLPSRGFLNPEIPEGKIIQRCMMVSDQKFLSGSNINPDDTIKELLSRTIETPDTVDIKNLTTADTMYLLFKLRILSYGSNYKFTTRCPECGRKMEVNLDLSTVEVNQLDDDYTSKLHIVLPRSGDTVYTKIMKNSDMDDIKEELERRRKRLGDAADESEFVLRLASMVTKIELKEANSTGDRVLEHPIDIQNYIEKLTDLDATAIRATTESLRYGVAPTVEYKCPHCKEDVDVNIQFSREFFRPKYEL